MWRESAFAFDNGCRLLGESNERLGELLAFCGDHADAVTGETIRLWRLGRRDAPFWAYRGLWVSLRANGHTAGELFGLLGFSFRE